MIDSASTNTSVQWVVVEDHPRPDHYIPIIVMPENGGNDWLKSVQHSIHATQEEAVSRASILKEKFEVNQIRVFYPDSKSAIIDEN